MENSSNKFIAFFIPSLAGGGAERVAVNLTGELSKRGIKVDLVLGEAEGIFLSEMPKGVHIVDLKVSRVLYALPKLIRYLKKNRPDFMISSLSHSNIIAVLAVKLSGTKTKILVKEDNTLSLASSNSLIKDWFVRFLVRFFYPMSDAVIAVSNGVKDDLVKNVHIRPEKIKIIYSPIITNEMFEKAKEPVLHPWFTSKSIPIIIAVGRLTNQKDFRTLIKAFSLVRKEIEVNLVILGEGEERKSLEDFSEKLGVSEYVYMPGLVDNPYKYMSKSDVFVLSSIYEGLPTVLVEALALGLPIVSTDCKSGPREILDNGKYGKLVPVGNAFLMKEAIISCLNGEVYNGERLDEHLNKFKSDYIVDCYINLLDVIKEKSE